MERRIRSKIIQLSYIVSLCFLIIVRNFNADEIKDVKEKRTQVKMIQGSVSSSTGIKKILFWNAEYGDFGFTFDDESAFERQNCKVTNCVLSKNKSLVPPETADAVVFLYTNLCNIPKIFGRTRNQRYILFTDDPPNCYTRNYYRRDPYFGSFFNWTMSYRSDADIPLKRGWIKKLDIVGNQTLLARTQMIEKYGKKKKLVAWYVARCGSKSERESYINELKEYIEIDSYGACGKLPCPGAAGDTQSCLDYIADNYKFVLTFERYICEDFVSKRFFDILNRNTVPIVLGAADYEKIAPPQSFINALKFSPKQLADRLLMLDKSNRLYYRHFWWKGSYEVHTNHHEITTTPICNLCEKLHRPEPHKIYRDVDSWWFNASRCFTLKDYGIQIKKHEVKSLMDIEIPWFSDE